MFSHLLTQILLNQKKGRGCGSVSWVILQQDHQKIKVVSPNYPLLLCILGDYYYILHNTQQAFECYQKAINSFQSLKQSEIVKCNLSQGNINFIIAKIEILKQLEEEIVQSKYFLEKLPTETLQEQQNKQNYITKIEQYQNEIKPILTIPINQSIRLENSQNKRCQQQDRNQIELLLNDLNKPENQYQKTYYQSLFWRLYNYLQAVQQISTDLFQINQNAVIETSSEKVLNIVQKISNIGSVGLSPIPIIGDAFQIINAALDYAIDEKNANKFNKRVKILSEILIFFAINPQQLEIEVQMAAISLGKQQQVNRQKRKQTIFTNRVKDLLAKESSSSELFKNIYWICGTEDALIILSYLEKNQEKILKEQQKKLREIFEDAVKSYKFLPQNNSPKVDTDCSSACQMI
ncbi:unnamed protein product [Paramecium pentaurelia]|uniref:Tetratricopeptide repeat protein n=1 Tax=Paramecium pentaurelia TaxID=43138 RepID=A0A8S1VQN7_9CILI|nr:unnamed protein product [Paramecium pentaurelia]